MMNSYNLDSILLKEKVGCYKLDKKEFRVQSPEVFHYPKLECNFERIKELMDKINVISEFSPLSSETSGSTSSQKRETLTSKGTS